MAKNSVNFNWSLNPLIVVMRIFGADLSEEAYRTHRWWKIGYASVFLLLNVSVQVVCVIFILKNKYAEDSNTDGHVQNTLTSEVNEIIDYANYGAYNIGGHLILLIAVRPKWNMSLKTLCRFESQLNAEYFVKLRRISYLGVILVVVWNVQLMITGAYDDWKNKKSIEDIMVTIFSAWGQIYMHTSVVLYALVMYASVSICDLTLQQIKNVKHRNDVISVRECYKLLKMWKMRQELIYKTVEEINECFDYTLLLSIFYLFIAFVNEFFYIFSYIMDGDYSVSEQLIDASYVTIYVLTLSLVCFPADFLSSKTEILLNELLKSKLPSQNSFNELITMQSFKKVPQISAAGFFLINKSLFLQIAANSITYFFVMHDSAVGEISSKGN